MSDWFNDIMAPYTKKEAKRSPFENLPQEDGDWFNDLMATAHTTELVYPTLDTRGKTPINDAPQGIVDFILDNLAAGTGQTIKDIGGFFTFL